MLIALLKNGASSAKPFRIAFDDVEVKTPIRPLRAQEYKV
jgi:hypothetical protein